MLPETGIEDLSTCVLIKLLNSNAQIRLQVQNNSLSELGFYQLLKGIKKAGEKIEQFVVDWVDIDEDAIREQISSDQYEDLEAVVTAIAALGERVVFVQVE